MSSAICFNLDQSKILSSGNGLMYFQTDDIPLRYFNTNLIAIFCTFVCQCTFITLFIRQCVIKKRRLRFLFAYISSNTKMAVFTSINVFFSMTFLLDILTQIQSLYLIHLSVNVNL